MSRFITIPAPVVPLLYSGLEAGLWSFDKGLEEAFPSRSIDPTWYGKPLEHLNRTAALLRIINWSRIGPPLEATVEIDRWRDLLLNALEDELQSQHGYRDPDAENSPELHEEAARDIAIIEAFLADLPRIEAAEGASLERAERAIALHVLQDDHCEKWSRAELEAALSDVEAPTVAEALDVLREETVVQVEGELVRASRCARHLDYLGMVSI